MADDLPVPAPKPDAGPGKPTRRGFLFYSSAALAALFLSQEMTAEVRVSSSDDAVAPAMTAASNIAMWRGVGAEVQDRGIWGIGIYYDKGPYLPAEAARLDRAWKDSTPDWADQIRDALGTPIPV